MNKKNTIRTDPSQNFIERYPQPLDAVFLPKNVAVIGAKDDAGTVGGTIMSNLLSGGFKGKVYPVNPHRKEVSGLPCFSSLKDVPEQVDLGIIVTPAHTVPPIVASCADAKVRSLIIISAGFKELGPAGAALEREILTHVRKANIPMIGPNCLGVMNPNYGLNATFARGMALKGNVAFISQSGALCTAVLDWSFRENIGFSTFVSIGSMADVDWGALIDYLGNDPHTHSLLLYMETIGNATAFLTAAREVALEKPIIVIKAGKSQVAAKAAASHTGSLAGSDDVFEAALERVGVLRVNTIGELFNMASVLGRQPRPRGPRLTIVTNAGGPAVLATDAAVLNDAELVDLQPETIERLNAFLPPAWSHSNPIDILGDATPDIYSKTLKVLTKDQHTDGVLVILTPQDMTEPTATAAKLAPYARSTGKPLLASWMGGEAVNAGASLLSGAGIPVFEYPDEAAKTFALMWKYSRTLRSLYETPELGNGHETLGDEERESKQAARLIAEACSKKRTLLTELESKRLLSSYDIPIVETLHASHPDEAVAMARKIGYPVVVKLSSETITHKSDVGGVKLGIKNPEEVVEAFNDIKEAVLRHASEADFGGVTVQRMVQRRDYELILGSTTDPQFGPVLLFGSGGQLVEIYQDRALGLPPLTTTLARRLMEKTKVYKALKGVRGKKAINFEALEKLMVRFSHMVVENPRIKECDVNPLIVSDTEMTALDARIVLHPLSLQDTALPQAAIRPYPLQYVKAITLKDGTKVDLRPIRPEDEPEIIEFHRELSEHSVRQRYFEFMSLDERVAHERLIRICFPDYEREWTTVAEMQQRIIGAARLFRIPGTRTLRFTMIIIDDYHDRGLGTALLKQLMHIAQQEKMEMIDAQVLSENTGMIHICRKLGFTISADKDPLLTRVQWRTAK